MKLFELGGQTAQAVNNNPALRAVAINEMRAATQIFEYAEFYTFTGNADSPKKKATEAGGAERTVNNDYSSVVGAPAYASASLMILGDKIKTDIAYERRSGKEGLASERARELASFSAGIGRYFMHQLINGSGGAGQFTGLKTQIAAGYTDTFSSADGGVVPMGNSDNAKRAQQEFIEQLDATIAQVGDGAVLIMDGLLKARLSSIAREHVTYQNIDGVYAPVTKYNETPIITAGYSKDKTTKVLPWTETCGQSTTCGSIYVVRFGEKEDVTFGTNVGMQVQDLGLVGTQYVTLVEMDVDLVLIDATAARRIEGIKLA